jgi:hypothetical protein
VELSLLFNIRRGNVSKFPAKSTDLKSRHEDVHGSGDIAPRILNLDTRWRWIVNFMPLLFSPLCPLDRRCFCYMRMEWYDLHRCCMKLECTITTARAGL